MSLCSSLTHSGGPAERNIQEGNLYTHCRNQWAGPTIQKKRTAAQSTHATVGYVSSLLDMLKWHRNLTSLHPAYYCRTFSYQDEAKKKKNDLKKKMMNKENKVTQVHIGRLESSRCVLVVDAWCRDTRLAHTTIYLCAEYILFVRLYM